jgi:hypothetical protein
VNVGRFHIYPGERAIDRQHGRLLDGRVTRSFRVSIPAVSAEAHSI